jgi:hypothetical protein
VRQSETCHDGCFVPFDALHQTLQFVNLTGFHQTEPALKTFTLTVAKHGHKILNQLIDGVSSRTRLANVSQFFSLGLI